MSRPAYLRPRLVALVGLGGAVGTTARYLLATALPPGDGWPTATFAANLLGAFLLGLLLEALARRRPETTRVRAIRLAFGTGMLGGFTTFSALALEIERMTARGDGALGLAYGLVSILLGVVCAGAGVMAAARRAAWRGPAGVVRPTGDQPGAGGAT